MIDDDDTDDTSAESEDFSSYDTACRRRGYVGEVTPPKCWSPSFIKDRHFGNERLFLIEHAVYEQDIDSYSPFKPVLSWEQGRRGTSHDSNFGFMTHKKTLALEAERSVNKRVEINTKFGVGTRQGPDISPKDTDPVNDEYTPVYSSMSCADLRVRARFFLNQAAFCRRFVHEAARAGLVAEVFANERELHEHQSHLRRIRRHLTSRNRRRRF